MKTCIKCGEDKPISEYHKYKRSSDGVRAVCKRCRRSEYESRKGAPIERREFVHLDPAEQDREAETGKRICSVCHEEHDLTSDFFSPSERNIGGFIRVCRLCVRGYSKEHYREIMETDPERLRGNWRRWSAANPEESKARFKRYHESHKAQCAAYAKKFRQANPDLVKARWDKWYGENGEAHNRAQNFRRRAVGYISRDTIRELIEANVAHYGTLTCVYCEAEISEYHVDHVRSIALGGTNDFENLAIACPLCNLSKGSKTVEEFLIGATA